MGPGTGARRAATGLARTLDARSERRNRVDTLDLDKGGSNGGCPDTSVSRQPWTGTDGYRGFLDFHSPFPFFLSILSLSLARYPKIPPLYTQPLVPIRATHAATKPL